jgi:hypothetical protein
MILQIWYPRKDLLEILLLKTHSSSKLMKIQLRISHLNKDSKKMKNLVEILQLSEALVYNQVDLKVLLETNEIN